jgi:hypothetical protein
MTFPPKKARKLPLLPLLLLLLSVLLPPPSFAPIADLHYSNQQVTFVGRADPVSQLSPNPCPTALPPFLKLKLKPPRTQ